MLRRLGFLIMAVSYACSGGGGGGEIDADASAARGHDAASLDASGARGGDAVTDAGADVDADVDAGALPGRWEALPPMPAPARYDLGAGAVKNMIYAVGGTVPATTTIEAAIAAQAGTLVQAFDITAGTWQTLAPLPSPFVMPNVATVGDRLFILGGLRTTTTLELDGQGHWAPRAALPLAGGRGAAAVGVWNGKIILAGGIIPGLSNNMLATGVRQVDVVAYDVAADTWTTLAPLPVAVAYSIAGVVGDKLWVIGGSTNDERTDAVHVLDLTANTWSEGTAIERSLSSAAVGVLGGRIYMAGGIATSIGMVSQETLAFDPAMVTLSDLAPIPTPRFSSAATVANGRLYVLGGLFEASATDIHAVTTVEALTP